MLLREDFRQPLYYENGNALTGSDGNLRFRVAPAEVKDGDEEDAPVRKILRVTAWPGPFCLEATADERKKTAEFALDEQGLNQAIGWLNKVQV